MFSTSDDQANSLLLKPAVHAACAVLFAFTLNGAASAQTEQSSRLMLDVEVGDVKGGVMIAIYDSEKSYEGGRPVLARRVAVDQARMQVVFENLPYGTYAIKAFHDLDGDGALTTNPFGMPIEPFAFSNGAKAHYGPPAFEKAAISVTSAEYSDQLRFLP